MRRANKVFGWLTAAGLVLTSGLAAAEREPPRPLLLGGGVSAEPREILLDPRLPTGSERRFGTRPEAARSRVCSFLRPVCVHGLPSVSEVRLLDALRAMETAHERLVLALGLPAPRDQGEGGSDALDLYLSEDTEIGGLEVWADAPRFQLFDQSSSYCVSGAASGLALTRAATLCVGEAIARSIDAGAAPHVQRAFATHLWWATGTPTALDAQAIDDLQARPEHAPLRRDTSLLSPGAATFFEVLERTHGRGTPVALARGLLTLGASSTRGARLEWNDEPDIFDVLRRTLDDSPRRMAELMNDWAVARAFIGSRDDGSHLPGLGWAGDFGRVRFDWSMRYSELPRRVAAKHPIEPTGSIYVLVELDDVTLGATLGFQAEWEAPVSFVWSMLQLDRQGRGMSRLDVPFLERTTKAEQRLQNFEGASYLMLVGTNLGGVDRDHPFDPDIYPYEAQLCTVYLVRL